MQRLIRIAIPLTVLALGFGVMKWIGHPTETPAPQQRPPHRLKTEVLELQRSSYPIIIKSQGNIRAHHATTLTPLVSGRILEISPQFEDGAFFQNGEPLVKLDPADYKATLKGAEAALARAEASLAQEQARAKQAKLNWDEIGYDEPPSDLVLRVPQLKEAHANVDAANANVDQAVRNLERTIISAPFDGRVRERSVGLGQTVSQGTQLGEVFGTGLAEVRLPLTPRQVAFTKLPENPTDPPLPVIISDGLSSNTETTWDARIVRTAGTLDESSRELFAIARIDDPYGLRSEHPPLRIGQPVRADIVGEVLEDVFVIPRDALRGVNRIHLVEAGELTLQRHEIEPIWSDSSFVIVKDGLESGQLLSITRLPYAPDGAPIEIIEAPAEIAGPDTQATVTEGS